MRLQFNQLIVKIIPLLPLFIVRLVAGRYVAGEKIIDALKVVKALNDKGFLATLDILGEHINDMNMAKQITNNYRTIIQSIHEQNLHCNISIKLSHIGMDISTKCIEDNMSKLIDTARMYNNFIRIDMEDSSATDKTFSIFRKYNDQYNLVGMVLQAYLHRTEDDLNNLKKESNLNFRLCKGIYRESSDLAIQDRNKINENYLKLLRFAFENNIYVGIATHDLFLINKSYDLISELNISKDSFEFQVLYGVPMSGWLEKHLEHDYKVRVYVPFGKDWYDYSIRRLKENPNIAGYVFRDIFKR